MRLLVVLLVVGSNLVLAGDIYRWVDEEGRVIFSDQPAPDAERVEPVPYASGRRGGVEDSSNAGDAGPYDSFEIAAPEDNAVVVSREGKVDIGLLVVPPLESGDRIQLLVNGVPVGAGQDRTQFSLRGVPFGTHRIQARVVDAAGTPVATTPTTTVHLRRPSVEESEPSR